MHLPTALAILQQMLTSLFSSSNHVNCNALATLNSPSLLPRNQSPMPISFLLRLPQLVLRLSHNQSHFTLRHSYVANQYAGPVGVSGLPARRGRVWRADLGRARCTYLGVMFGLPAAPHACSVYQQLGRVRSASSAGVFGLSTPRACLASKRWGAFGALWCIQCTHVAGVFGRRTSRACSICYASRTTPACWRRGPIWCTTVAGLYGAPPLRACLVTTVAGALGKPSPRAFSAF